MRTLKAYLEELSTPGNTIGMGNPGMIDGETLTEPIEGTAKCIRQCEKKKRKKIKESLFDDDLVTKEPWEDEGFKKWINRPDVLWYLYEYWANDFDEPLNDFMSKEWELYKPIVDVILDEINQKTKNMWPMYKISYESAEFFPEIADCFANEEEFLDLIDAAMYEVKHKSVLEYDGVWKTWFKGTMPKRSNVTQFLSMLPEEGSWMTKPGVLAGGIFLTNEDSLLVWSFPRGLDKKILSIFGIK